MTDDYLLLVLHLLGASIWTGGHLVLALGVLPKALDAQDVTIVTAFEDRFERIGIPALILQGVTGLIMADRYLGGLSNLFDDNGVARAVLVKVALLVITIALAADARIRLIPHLTNARLRSLAWHIRTITVVAVLFVVFGATIRYGGSPLVD